MMSTHRRLAKGTAFTSGNMIVGILGQIVVVPIYLSVWGARTYGFWLIFLGFQSYLSLFSVAYQQYTYAEALRHGRNDWESVRCIYWRSLAVGYVITALEFAVFLSLVSNGMFRKVSSEIASTDPSVFDAIVLMLVLLSLLNLIAMPFGAITQRTLVICGHYPRFAAWGLFNTLITLIIPTIAVGVGADFKTAAFAFVAARSTSAFLSSIDIWRLAKRYDLLRRAQIDWRMGLLNALYCLPLAGQGFIDSLRQQGFRIVLGAYVGPASVTTLATTRTLGNVLQQGLGTVTGPLLPELMRYVAGRDQERMEGAFALVWLSIFALLMPGVLTLALLGETVFAFWTRGAVEFDAILFLTLMSVVTIYAAAQPAMAILQGRNCIAWITWAAVAAALGLGVFSPMLIPLLGLRGAGLALLAAELCALVVVVQGALRSLAQSGLRFPMSSLRLVLANIVGVFGVMFLGQMIFSVNPAFIVLALLVNLAFAAAYWKKVPLLARERILQVLTSVKARFLSRA
jgi:O-antigen/teichoic acid export membrane protein